MAVGQARPALTKTALRNQKRFQESGLPSVEVTLRVNSIQCGDCREWIPNGRPAMDVHMQESHPETWESWKELRMAAEVADKEAKVRTPKAKKDCLCGCGGETGGKFVPGHDAKVKSTILNATKLAEKEGKPVDLKKAGVPVVVIGQLDTLFKGAYAAYKK